MPDRMQYVESSGRVPRGMAEIGAADQLRQVLLLKLALDAGGRFAVGGLGDPEAIAALMLGYELKISGSGDGAIVLEAVPKPR